MEEERKFGGFFVFSPSYPISPCSLWPFSSQDAYISTEGASLLEPTVICWFFKTVLWTPRELGLINQALGPPSFPPGVPGEKAGWLALYPGGGPTCAHHPLALPGLRSAAAERSGRLCSRAPTACQRFVHVRGWAHSVRGSALAPRVAGSSFANQG